eukprot:scaffold179_cov368-Prasinococcus_capsulatus_cf.AAC.37
MVAPPVEHPCVSEPFSVKPTCYCCHYTYTCQAECGAAAARHLFSANIGRWNAGLSKSQPLLSNGGFRRPVPRITCTCAFRAAATWCRGHRSIDNTAQVVPRASPVPVQGPGSRPCLPLTAARC